MLFLKCRNKGPFQEILKNASPWSKYINKFQKYNTDSSLAVHIIKL